MLVETTAFMCDKCGKIHPKKLDNCTCENKYKQGQIVGSFRLLSKLDRRMWKVTCRICDVFTVIDTSNIQRQLSCGCKPKHINFGQIKDTTLTYSCRRCGSTHTDIELPIYKWCCENSNE